MSSEKKGPSANEKKGKNTLEWVTFGFSLVVIVATLGYLVYETIHHKITPPEIAVTYTPQPTENSPHRYHLMIKNIGGQTAEQVVIRMLLMDGDTTVEESEVQMDFVPQHSSRESWVNFVRDPGEADTLLAKVVSFKKP